MLSVIELRAVLSFAKATSDKDGPGRGCDDKGQEKLAGNHDKPPV
jgi:hypothetical protein